MTFRRWELTAAVVGGLVAATLLTGGAIIEGVVVGALSVYWFFGRARVPERLGAQFLGRTATLELVKAGSLGVVVMLATIATVFLAFALHWNRSPEGRLLFLALTGVMVLLKEDIAGRVDRIERLERGGRAEVAVSGALHALHGEWTVEDNHLRGDGRGNVDHVVRRPDGEWFAIETKSGNYRSRHLGQAVSCAVAAKQDHGLHWVTPVLCVDDPDRQPELRTVGSARVWVVDRRRLSEWIASAPSTRGAPRSHT